MSHCLLLVTWRHTSSQSKAAMAARFEKKKNQQWMFLTVYITTYLSVILKLLDQRPSML
jgi:hypothetical protein